MPPPSENFQRALRGELYHAFTPELVAKRRRCAQACANYNDNAGLVGRRRQVEMWREIVNDTTPLPPPPAPPSPTTSPSDLEALDASLFDQDPWIEPPIRIDYGSNLVVGPGVFVNFNCTIIDTCRVSIGARTLVAPNVSLYSGTHPTDPLLRNGTRGPELGREIVIEEDCWIGGNVVICPGVRVGRGSTVGAGSVVTRDVKPFSVVAGNPARFIREAPRETTTEEERKRILDIANAE